MKNSKKAMINIIGIFIVTLLITGVFMTLFSSSKSEPNAQSSSQQTKPENQTPVLDAQMPLKAMWISYLEYQNMNMASKEGFIQDVTNVFQNCKDIGLNTVIVHVRPFGDALYASQIFPQSHLLTGMQGVEAGYDPLKEMIEIAHSMGLRLEAWVNPYRVQLNGKTPQVLAASNPANDESLVFHVEGGTFYNPALEQVQQLVVDGVMEIVNGYDIDGIHFDDYFYPTTDPQIDAQQYQASGTSLSVEDWRRENVNTLIKKVYAAIKQKDSTITFGISPQGNNDNNYNSQYSDVCLWLSTPGYADYIMPQLYWGFYYLTKSQSDRYQFAKLLNEWANYPRAQGVKLHIGLGAYRLGVGDGGFNDQAEWTMGGNIAKMIHAIYAHEQVDGYAIYRYSNLFDNKEYPQLAQVEAAAIKQENTL